jgi:hypothetical protein
MVEKGVNGSAGEAQGNRIKAVASASTRKISRTAYK